MSKNILLFIFLSLTGIFGMQAQDKDKGAQREHIKALKVAFFTQELDLSEKLAEKFWPIYNRYEKERRDLHKREHIDLDNIECIDEKQAEDLLDEFLLVESEEYKIKKQLFRDLRQIISAKDIIKLHKLEDEFHKKLIKEYRSKKDRERSDNDKN
tara:strand:- start:71 stop:535 length:465 start_codon:yes stop_codon:yes gene_type:complete